MMMRSLPGSSQGGPLGAARWSRFDLALGCTWAPGLAARGCPRRVSSPAGSAWSDRGGRTGNGMNAPRGNVRLLLPRDPVRPEPPDLQTRGVEGEEHAGLSGESGGRRAGRTHSAPRTPLSPRAPRRVRGQLSPGVRTLTRAPNERAFQWFRAGEEVCVLPSFSLCWSPALCL